MTDEKIVALINQDDIKGLELLFERYFSIVSKSAFFVLKDDETAKDLSQDLFMKLWSQRRELSNIKNLKAYLITSIKNLALNYIKKENRNKNKLKDYLELSFDNSYTEFLNDDSEKKLLEKNIQKIISSLPPRCRLIFMLSRFEGLTNGEIAEYLDISKTTVERQITTALNALRKGLVKKVIGFISISLIILVLCYFLFPV